LEDVKMNNVVLLILVLLFFGSFTIPQEKEFETRYIEVVGSAEMNVAPDEIYFVIGLEEYWKEEFEKRVVESRFRTRVPLELIEEDLYSELKKIGIEKDQIIVNQLGNYWRQTGKDILLRKELQLKLEDFQQVETIVNEIKTRGINYMRIHKLENSKLGDYRQEVKIEALRAAKKKANYLLESVDLQLGEILQVYELNPVNSSWSAQDMRSNTMLTSQGGDPNLKTIPLRYEMKVRFKIKS